MELEHRQSGGGDQCTQAHILVITYMSTRTGTLGTVISVIDNVNVSRCLPIVAGLNAWLTSLKSHHQQSRGRGTIRQHNVRGCINRGGGI